VEVDGFKQVEKVRTMQFAKSHRDNGNLT